MKREILFRCWNKFDKKFIYFKEGIYNSDIDFKESASPSYFFNWEHVEQFTGLLDKNGTNIFEGDLIQGCFEPDPSPNFKGCMINLKKYSVNAKVVFFNNGFCLQNLIKGRAKKAWVHKGLSKVKDLEIIGNIHDHAKL